MFLKQIFALRANILVLKTTNFQGATIRPIVPRQKHSNVLLFTTKFSSTLTLKNKHLELFLASEKFESGNVKNETKPDKKPNKYRRSLNANFFVSVGPLVYKNISRTSTIHSGVLLGRAP